MKYYKEANNIEPPEKPSRYFMVYGLLVEYFFNIYTNGYLKKGIKLSDEQIYAILRKIWAKVLDENYVVWTDPWCRESSEHIFMSAYEDVLKNINTFDFWKDAQADISFEILLKKSQDILSCRFDFIVNNSEGTTEILEGKGTYSMDKAMDLEQLYFYIFVYYLHYKKLPDKAGFIFYKFQTIRYIDFDMNVIQDFKNKLAIVKNAIKKDKVFEAKVGISKQCKWCDYRMTCDALINKRQERADKKKPTITFDFDGGILSFSPKGIFDEGSD
jgi:CRISPR/Cas system-associated exonuclease Cas4 (RecB family)